MSTKLLRISKAGSRFIEWNQKQSREGKVVCNDRNFLPNKIGEKSRTYLSHLLLRSLFCSPKEGP